MILGPEDLMRNRYDAFVAEDWAYIAKTSLHQSIDELKNSIHVDWLKLEVLDTYDNIVEFKAYYKENGKIHVLHEKSSFIFKDNVWLYAGGKLFNSKVNRNEACPCGSTKKYKKCCA